MKVRTYASAVGIQVEVRRGPAKIDENTTATVVQMLKLASTCIMSNIISACR